MKRALIIGSQKEADWSFLFAYLRGDEYIICADGGQITAYEHNLSIDWFVGDSDSGGVCVDQSASDILPCEKDVTDLVMAVSRAIAIGAEELLICGCSGGRMDHYLSAIGQLERIHRAGLRGLLIDANNEISLLSPGTVSICNNPLYRYFGIVPLDDVLSDVSIHGAKYEVDHVDFSRCASLGVSNELTLEQNCSITIGKGLGLFIRSRG